MDLLRSCKTNTFVLAPGEAPVTVRWFFAPPGAKWFPGVNAFTSSTWDATRGLGAPPIGEQELSTGYDKGINFGGYLGRCRVGSDQEYANGALPATVPPTPLPLCCRTVLGGLLHLRSDLAAPLVSPPSAIMLPWDNTGIPVTCSALSPAQGTGIRGSPFTFPVHGGPVHFTEAFWQYASAVLGAGTITARRWKLTLGYQGALGVGGPVSVFMAWSVAVVSVSSGLVEVLVSQRPIGVMVFGSDTRQSALDQVDLPDVELDDDEFLLLEIGFSLNYPLHLPTLARLQVNDCGTGGITAQNVNRNNPDALLDFSTPNIPNPEVDDVLPGTLIPYAGVGVPVGYLLCDGSIVLQALYPALFSAIGSSWGAAAPGFFVLPDLRDRTVIGASPGAVGPGRPSPQAVGQSGGEETHQLLVGELARHDHPVVDPGHSHAPPLGFNNWFYSDPVSATLAFGVDMNVNLNSITDTEPTGITLGTTGADTPHNNMQPFGVVTWCIKT